MSEAKHAAFPGDRRGAPRVETDLNGSFGHTDEAACRVLNISTSGALAVSPTPVTEFSEVKMRLQVAWPDGGAETLVAQAATVRCDRRADGRFDVGLFFTSMTPENRELLERLVACRLAAPAPRA